MTIAPIIRKLRLFGLNSVNSFIPFLYLCELHSYWKRYDMYSHICSMNVLKQYTIRVHEDVRLQISTKLIIFNTDQIYCTPRELKQRVGGFRRKTSAPVAAWEEKLDIMTDRQRDRPTDRQT